MLRSHLLCLPFALCPLQVGTFQSSQSQSACDRCGPGTFSGSPQATSCNLCPVGKYGPASGATACANCPLGRYASTEGSQLCQSCPVGSYNPIDTAPISQCPQCPAGSYANSTGSQSCTLCPEGSYLAFPGRTACELCPSMLLALRTCAPLPSHGTNCHCFFVSQVARTVLLTRWAVCCTTCLSARLSFVSLSQLMICYLFCFLVPSNRMLFVRCWHG